MDNNFKFKTRHVSIVQRSSSVVNSFTSSVDLITNSGVYVKARYNSKFRKTNVQFKMCDAGNDTSASTTLNTKGRKLQKMQVSQIITSF